MLISKNDITNINEKIKEFENKHSIKLPSDYHLFLERYNGGKTPKTEFKLNRRWTNVREFYGLTDENDIHSIYWMEKQWFYDEYLEDKMLIIANNMFGDYILIGIGEENYGMVYFRYHDRKKKYIKLTDSFKEFIDTCRSKKIGHVESIFERIVGMHENGLADEVDDITIKCWQEEIDRYENIHQEEVILTKEYTPRFVKKKDNQKDNIETLNYEELIERMNNENSDNKRLSCLLRLCKDYTNKENIELIYQLAIENALKTEPYPGYVYFDILHIAYKKDYNLFRRIKMSNKIRKILYSYLENEIVFSDEYKYKKKNDSLNFYSEENMRLKIKKVVNKY